MGRDKQLVGMIVRGRGIARHGYPVHEHGDERCRRGSSPAARRRRRWACRSRWATCRRPTPRSVPWSTSPFAAPRVEAEIVPLPFYKRAAVARRPETAGGEAQRAGARRPSLHHDHEWLRVEGDEAVVGITEYAAGELGDVVFVELPAAGMSARAGAVVRRHRVGQDGIRPVQPGGRRGPRGQRRAGRQARAGQRRPVRRGLDDPPPALGPDAAAADSERLMDAAAYRSLIEAG